MCCPKHYDAWQWPCFCFCCLCSTPWQRPRVMISRSGSAPSSSGVRFQSSIWKQRTPHMLCYVTRNAWQWPCSTDVCVFIVSIFFSKWRRPRYMISKLVCSRRSCNRRMAKAVRVVVRMFCLPWRWPRSMTSMCRSRAIPHSVVADPYCTIFAYVVHYA